MASLRPPEHPPGTFATSSETLMGHDGSLYTKSAEKKYQSSIASSITVDVEKQLPVLPTQLPSPIDIPSIPKPSVEIEGHRFIIIMFCLCLGNFLAYFTETAVMTSLRVIGNEFHDSSNQAWIASAYTLGFILPQLIIGRLCDIFGRSSVYNATIALFAIGTLWCGLSETFPSLLAARVIQGIGAAGRQTVGSVVIIDLTTKHNRGTWLGFFNFALSIGLTFGLLIGALITTHTTWRWSFWTCLIGMALVFLLGVRFMYYPVPNREQSVGILNQLRDVNWIGTLGSMVIAALICVPLQLGVNNCPWSSSAVIAPLVTGFLLIPVWIHYEENYPQNPVLELSTFALPNIKIATVLNFLSGSAYMGAIFFLPRFFTAIKKNSSLISSGVQLSGVTLSEGFTSAFGGLLMCKTGQIRWVAFAGALLISLGSGLFINLRTDSDVALPIAYSTLIGIGCGLIYQPSSVAGPSSVQPHQVAAVASWLNFARGFGGIVHAAVLAASFDGHLSEALGDAASASLVREGLSLADNWQQYPEYASPIGNLLVQTFKVGAVIGIVSGGLMGLLVLMLKGLDFKPEWWIKQRIAKRDSRLRQAQNEKLFEPRFYPY